MKTHKRMFLIGSVVVLGYLSTSCGRREAVLPTELPDRLVDVTETVGHAVSAEQSRDMSVDEFFEPIRQKVGFTLAQAATFLAELKESEYLKVQQKWIGSRYPACNYFLISALCESDYCETSKPFYKAAAFDLYFLQTGWKPVTLAVLKHLFRIGARFDAVFQKDGVTKDRPGHVMVAVGLDPESEQIRVAEGHLGTISHHLETITDRYIQSWNGGFRIFVNQAQLN